MNRNHRHLLAAAALGGFMTTAAHDAAAGVAEARQVDRYIEEGLQRHGTTPNLPSTDEEFLRRIYLDIVGRIPTYDEAKGFLDRESPTKRTELIRELLNSEGYVSHTFNWWADVLRLKTDGTAEIDASGKAYKAFVKRAVRENMPYDQFVRELVNPSVIDKDSGERVTGEPVFAWDNGAAGYYMRDSGMPLDNMSNTLQVFMGTRVVCAQCHDHPFDKWSQMDYHELAAFTYNSIDTRVRPAEVLELDQKLDRRSRERDRYLTEALNDLFQPLNYGVTPTERILKLPHDYRSEKDKADPYEEVRPSTKGFTDAPPASRGKSHLLENYAEWLTSSENQRFNRVIANRLWKRVFGRGLVEPVDDWKDETEPSNRYVLDYITRLVVQNRYDLKAVLETLYNTRTYQRQAFGDDIHEDTHFHFPGPVLRRMSAEQIWDSFMTVAVPEIDERIDRDEGYGNQGLRYQKDAEMLLTVDKTVLLKLAEDIADLNRDLEPKLQDLRDNRGPGTQKRINELTAERDSQVEQLRREAFASAGDSGASPMMMERTPAMADMEMQANAEGGDAAADPERWKGYDRGFVRASELDSPASASHFLRQFGQSDRETIENASNQPSVDQALTLLNSPIFDQMFHDRSQLAADLATAATPQEKQDILFVSLLSRYPRDRDRDLVSSQVERYGEDTAYRNVAWALMNTQEFVFLQ